MLRNKQVNGGKRTPLLLLPGMMCNERLWAPQIEAFAREREVMIADFSKAASISEMTLSALDCVNRHQIEESFAIAGLSMGGIVAFDMWRRCSDRVAGLALLDTNHRADAPSREKIRRQQIKDARRGWLYWLLRDELKPTYQSSDKAHDQLTLESVMAMGLEMGPGAFTRQSSALLNREDSIDTLASISCPTLVLCGEGDTLCPPQLHDEMASLIKGAEFRTIASSGHLPTLERPTETTVVLSSWLNRVDASTGKLEAHVQKELASCPV